MSLLDRGQLFIDFTSPNHQGVKPKYHIAITSGDFDYDIIVCFVFNSEKLMQRDATIGCKKQSLKYIIEPKTFSFIQNYTSIILKAKAYKLDELITSSSIKLFETADNSFCEKLLRCIDSKQIEIKFLKLIESEYKIKI